MVPKAAVSLSFNNSGLATGNHEKALLTQNKTARTPATGVR